MNPPLPAELLQNCPIAVTGMGVFSAAGKDVESFWKRLVQGHSTAEWLPASATGDGTRLAGCPAEEPQFDTETARTVRRMDRHVQFAMAAFQQAWQDASLDKKSFDRQRIGIVAGTSRGPVGKWAESVQRLATGRMPPSLAANSTIACLSGALAQSQTVHGPCFTVSAACASSAAAIATGAVQLLLGAADVMLVGGAEAPLNPLVLNQLRSVGVLGSAETPEQCCRPFDAARNGTVLGEGAAFLVLEPLAAARRRGANIRALFAGWALGMDTAGRTGIDESGSALFQTMQHALQMAGLPPAAVGYLNAHGTGTRLNDRLEAKAVQRLFGAANAVPPCSSTKAVTGHCMGAAAALEAVAGILALEKGLLPPSANCRIPDPDCPIHLIRDQARTAPVRVVLSNSAGFWGHNASLIFQRPD